MLLYTNDFINIKDTGNYCNIVHSMITHSPLYINPVHTVCPVMFPYLCDIHPPINITINGAIKYVKFFLYLLMSGYKINIEINIADIYHVCPTTAVDLMPDISKKNRFHTEFTISFFLKVLTQFFKL